MSAKKASSPKERHPQDRQQGRNKKRRQPNKGSFCKGDPRINRGGLPAEARAFHEAFKRALCEELSKPSRLTVGGISGAQTRFERGAKRLAELFEAGEPWAVHEVLDRLVGRPTQSLEMSGKIEHEHCNVELYSDAELKILRGIAETALARGNSGRVLPA